MPGTPNAFGSPQTPIRIQFTAAAAPTVAIMGSATRSSEVTVHVSGTWTATVQTKSFLPGNGLAIADRQPIPYKGKTGALTDPSATGITTNGVYKVPLSAGEMFCPECTAFTSGTIILDCFVSPLS